MVPPMPKLSAQYGRLPASALLIRELTPPLSPKKRMWQPYGSTHAQILVHRTAGSPLLLCSKGSLPRPTSLPSQKPKPPKTGSDLCEWMKGIQRPARISVFSNESNFFKSQQKSLILCVSKIMIRFLACCFVTFCISSAILLLLLLLYNYLRRKVEENLIDKKATILFYVLLFIVYWNLYIYHSPLPFIM